MNRTTTRAAFISVLLHAGLLLLVFGMRPPPPPPAPPEVVKVRVVRLEDLPATRLRAGDPAARGHRDPPAAEVAPPMRDAETVPDPPAAPAPESMAARTEASREEATTPGNLSDAPPEPPALPELPAPAASGPETVASSSLALPAAPVVELAPPAQPDFAAAEPAMTQPATQPIAEKEREMLDRRFSDWTGSFDAKRTGKTMTWRHGGRTYTATMKHIPAEDDMTPGRIVVRISTEQDGETLSMEMQLRQLAFSNFAQFVDRWNPAVQIHDDAVDGRFHANSAIHLAYGEDAAPVFHGLVTLAARTIKDESRDRLRRDELFPGGLKTGVRRIDLPRHALPLSDDSFPANAHRFARSARITFEEDGSYRWSYLEPEGAAAEESRRIDAGGHYLIGPEDGALHVRGVVRGRVLVYAPETIVVEGDLVYATFPPTGPDGGDYLGLVADGSIEIAEPAITGPGDLVIHGSLYARRQLAVRDYHVDERATLLVYGSVTAGSLGATEPRYATRILFDRRLDAMRPPGFPLTDRYELEHRDPAWTRETADTEESTSM